MTRFALAASPFTRLLEVDGNPARALRVGCCTLALLILACCPLDAVAETAGDDAGEYHFICAGNGRLHKPQPHPRARTSIAGKATAATTTGTLSALVIFAKFRGEATGADEKPEWADDLFDLNLPGSFAHFYNEMSRGQLRIGGQVLPKRYTSLSSALAYTADVPGTEGKFAVFNLEILRQADLDVDMGLFDNDGPDGIPNSGDDDGYVDIVFINLLTVPRDFFISTASGFGTLGLETDFLTNDAAAGGGVIRIRSRHSGFGGTTQRGHVFTVTSGTMTHEFGHVLGLPDLFDQSSVTTTGELDPEADSAGIGKWGLMGLGTLGWGVENGPNAFCAWSLAQLGWLGVNNENLVVVEESITDVELEQIDAGGRVLKVPVSEDEYFLIENRQATGSYYNREIPGEGLLLWHVDEWADNDEERHKQVDLVCADGLYADAGFPGSQPDPTAGGDNLDHYARDSAYNDAHGGNQGDATDPFDGSRFRRFAHDTNPAARAHSGSTRGIPLGFALEEISAIGGGVMRLDVLLRQPVAGNIAQDTTWSGEVVVTGDVVVERGATLTIEDGTTVRFMPGDDRGAGFDPDRSELIVYGNLSLPSAGDGVDLRSGAERPRGNDWFGLLLMSGQAPGLEEAVTTGALRIENSRFGIVRPILPAGQTVWGSGRRNIPMDIIVPAGAELVLQAGADVRFAAQDIGLRGARPELVELVVAGALSGGGSAGNPSRLTTSGIDVQDLWYGILADRTALVDLSFVDIRRCLVALSGEIPGGTSLRITDSVVERTVFGLSFDVFGELLVDRTDFNAVTLNALRVRGTGSLRIRDADITGCGQEGILSANCSIEAIDLRLQGNGVLDPEDPRSGLLATGGRGQRIELWRSTVADNTLHGIDLSAWEGVVELHGSEVSANKSQGLLASGLELLVFEDNRIVRNLGRGAQVGNAPVEIWTTEFEDNIGTGLVLEGGATGAIEMSLFRNGTGLELDGLTSMILRSNRFESAGVGLESRNSSPSVVLNRFENNLIAIKVGAGGRVPSEIVDNSFIGNTTGIQNESGRLVVARGNYWGTADSSAIASQVEGNIDWAPYLPGEPGATAMASPVVSTTPERFAVRQNHPNPFNATTVIPVELPRDADVELTIYDVLGRSLRRLLSRTLVAGYHRVVWDGLDDAGRPVGSGLYFFRFSADEFNQSGRMLLLRGFLPSDPYLGAQQLLHQLGIGLAASRLHDLSHKEPYRFLITTPDFLDRVAVIGEDLGDGLFQL